MSSVDRINGLTGDLAIKTPVRVATTANITLSGLQTIDGVSLAAGDRVLVKNQTDAVDNGIWTASTSSWSRALDFDGSYDCVQGTLVSVTSGTVNEQTVWQLTTANPVIGTSSLTFERGAFSDAANMAADDGASGSLWETVQGFINKLIGLTGASHIGGAGRVVGSIAALRTLDKTLPSKHAFVTSYYTQGLGGGGAYWYDSTDTTSADNGGSIIVADDGGRWKLVETRTLNAAQFGIFPVGAGAISAADTAARLVLLRAAAVAAQSRVIFDAGTYELPPQTELQADNTEWVFAPGTVLKLHDTQATDDFLVFSAPSGQRVLGLRVDGNRAVQDDALFGVDNAACLAVDATDCTFENPEIISSPGKGFVVVSYNGGTSSDVDVTGFRGGDCATQALLIDGNNSTGLFERITVSKVRIGATSHGGLVINDGAHNVTVSDVIADVQNTTWDAVSIRDSYDIQMANVKGKRGRNGVYLQRLNGYTGRIQLDNVIGELSDQNGVLMAGAEDVTGGSVVGRNNGGGGINIADGPAGYRCKNITIAAPAGYDDQGVPTQEYGILVQGVDGCNLGKHIAYGNITKQLSIVRAETSLVDAEVRQVASGTTGSIASSSQAVVTLSWPSAFEDASIDIEAAYVFEATSSLALSVAHVVAITTSGVQVMVKNLSGTTAHTGTLTVIGRRTI